MAKKIEISCSDGVVLAGKLYAPNNAKAAVMIAPATGIKKEFYNSFANYLFENNIGVICFDNRGIGESINKGLNKCDASLVNWGRLDMSAVLERLKSEFPKTSYHLIGHSAGGQLVGLMNNSEELTSMFNFACSSGSLRLARYPFYFKSFFFLNIFIPISNLVFGHTKSQWVGMGEPLPKKVAREWSRFCNRRGYIKDDLDIEVKKHSYDELEILSKWLYAIDDEIATDKTVPDMISVYKKVKFEILPLVPSEYGFKSIGHMKFFSQKRKSLWPIALKWIEEQLKTEK